MPRDGNPNRQVLSWYKTAIQNFDYDSDGEKPRPVGKGSQWSFIYQWMVGEHVLPPLARQSSRSHWMVA